MNAEIDLVKKRVESAKLDRRCVEVAVNVDDLSERLDNLRNEAKKTLKALEKKEEENKEVAKLQKEVLMLQSAALPSEEEIVKLESMVEELPSEDSDVRKLVDEIQLIRQKKNEREAMKDELTKGISDVAEEVSEMDKALLDMLADNANKFEANDVDKLKKLDEKLQSVLHEQLNAIIEKAEDRDIPMDGVEVEVERIQRLADKLKVSIVAVII